MVETRARAAVRGEDMNYMGGNVEPTHGGNPMYPNNDGVPVYGGVPVYPNVNAVPVQEEGQVPPPPAPPGVIPLNVAAPPAENPMLHDLARMLAPRLATRTHLFSKFRKQRPPTF